MLAQPHSIVAEVPTQVSGTVLDVDGLPVARARVRIRSSNGEISRTTDKRGFFVATGVPTGQTRVYIQAGWSKICEYWFNLTSGEGVYATSNLWQNELDEHGTALPEYEGDHDCNFRILPIDAFDRYLIHE
jgi:hypothetical protein